MAESNKTKSLFIVISSLLSLLLIVAGIFAAVMGIKQVTCTHVWDDGTVKTEATCAEDGELVYTCERCEKTQSKAIKKISHTWKIVEAKDATCTENGHEAYTVCEVCQEYKEGYEFKVDLAKGHTEVDDMGVSATCTENGLTAGKHCTTCGEVTVKQREIPASGHKIVQVEAKEATCTQSGNTAVQKCSTCGVIYVGEEIPALGHLNEDGDVSCDRCGVSAEQYLTDPSEFKVGKWYRFYVDLNDPTSEAYIKINLQYDGSFDGWYKELGDEHGTDMPFVQIGISSANQGGYIYWGDKRLTVDFEIIAGDGYIDIYLAEGNFGRTADSDSPEIYIEINTYTEVLEVFSTNGGYVAVLDEEIMGYEM